MPTTILVYPKKAVGSSQTAGQLSSWSTSSALARVLGPIDGKYATNTKQATGVQRLLLNGYDLPGAIRGANGNAVPWSVDGVRVQVAFQVQKSEDFDSINVLLLDRYGATIATGAVDLTTVAWATPTVRWVTFLAHDNAAPLTWADLGNCQIAVDVHWAAAAALNDTFQVDAVGVYASFTATEPNPTSTPALAKPATITTLRLYDQGGNQLSTLPWATLARTIVRNAPGGLTAAVPASLLPTLGSEPYLRLVEDGVESPDWYILDDDGDDPTDAAGGARPVQIGASGVLTILDWAEVYPYGHTPGGTLLGLDPTYPFSLSTPGQIMGALIAAAQARGCLPQLSFSFTDDRDSAGQLWPKTFTRIYNIGDTLLKVLTTMNDDGWADFEMIGFRLDMYVPDTRLADDHPETVLRLGQGVTTGPRKRTRKTSRSVLMANGAQGAIIEVSDADALASLGRREGYEGRAGITDFGTLTAATNASLARQTKASESITLALEPAVAPPLPRPGGYVRYDQRRLDASTLEPMRVQSIAYEYGDAAKVSVELADLWLNRDVRLKRQIDAVLVGSSANERVPQQPYVDDGVAPAAPTGLSINSAPYTDDQGNWFAQITATWVNPTTNTNGTPCQDQESVDIEWRQLDAKPGSTTIHHGGTVPLAVWSPVIPGTNIDVRIRAVDRWGNGSDWTGWVSITTGADDVAPPQPTKPLVDNYLGLIRARWDGAFMGGSAVPGDLDRVEVHAAPISGFAIDLTPVTGTLAGSMLVAGPVFISVPYGETRYVVLVAVDRTGNRSIISAEASATSAAVVSADVFDGAIGTAKLADLAVVSAKIGLLAVNTAQIGSIDVGKLDAGDIHAQVTISGSISTSADPSVTGGVQLNGTGIFQWDTTGAQTVAINSSGALLTGIYKTALAGRRIEVGAGGTTGMMSFYSPDGQTGFVRAYTQSNGVEAIQIGMQQYGTAFGTGNSLWNRLNFNTSPNGEYCTFKSGTLELTYDGSSVQKSADGTQSGVGRFVVYQTANRATGAGQQRFYIDPNTAAIVAPAGYAQTTFQTDGQVKFEFGTTSAAQGFVNIKTAGSTGTASGGGVQMFNSGGYGNMLKFVNDGTATSLQVRTWDDSGFQPIYASAFTVNSDARAKADIVDSDLDALALIRAARVRRYTRRNEARRAHIDEAGRIVAHPTAAPQVNSRVEVGLVAQEAPGEIVVGTEEDGLGIDLYPTVTLLIGAVQQLADRLGIVEGTTKGGTGK